MAKALGLIGNFTGKLGNTVGYNLKDSNNKQTQGVRVYQPVVKNPKTAAQAEQRAKLAPINATYRALKAIIDRGQEGIAYGNKSRLAWLSDAIKAFNGGWFEKGATNMYPAVVPLTKGSLAVRFLSDSSTKVANISGLTMPAEPTGTVGEISAAIIARYPQVQEGDQLTFINVAHFSNGLSTAVRSLVIDTTSTKALSSEFMNYNGTLSYYDPIDEACVWAVVLSREGDNGQHLRSTTSLNQTIAYPEQYFGETAKAAAIASYMSQGANTDWAEESIM